MEGSLTTRKWQDKSGADRYSTEIKAQTVRFLDPKNSQNGQNGQQSQAPGRNNGSSQSASPDYSDVDNIPF